MQQLTSIVKLLGDEHTEDNHEDIILAMKYVGDLSEYFKKFDILLKKLNEIKPENEREKRLLTNIKLRMANSVSENVPYFREIFKNVKIISEKPVQKKGMSAGNAVSNTNKSLLDKINLTPFLTTKKSIVATKIDLPVITHVNPAAVPLKGAKVTITGNNFSHLVTLLVDVTEVKCEYMDSTELVATLPELGPGFKTIKIINPNKTSAQLENVLHYMAEMPSPATSNSSKQKQVQPFKFDEDVSNKLKQDSDSQLSISSVIPAVREAKLNLCFLLFSINCCSFIPNLFFFFFNSILDFSSVWWSHNGSLWHRIHSTRHC